MDIVKQKWEFLHHTLPVIPKKIRHLYCFGFSTLAFRTIVSLRSNARLLNLNWWTAKSKAYRVVMNKRLVSFFPQLMHTLSLVRPSDIIAVDFSDFNGFQVLMFAKQTRKGRALPVYFEVLTYPIQKGSQNIFVMQAIQHFTDTLGFRPRLVFDRGFACPSVIAYLSLKKHPFLIRIKKKKCVMWENKKYAVQDLPEQDSQVWVYRRTLRIIISARKEDVEEPWYLVTNDETTSREAIIDQYYHRFEIEEFFRDAKRLLGLEYVRFKQTQSLSAVLWFLLLGLWFVETLEEQKEEAKQRGKFQLSRMRYVFEMMQKEIFLATEGQYWLATRV